MTQTVPPDAEGHYGPPKPIMDAPCALEGVSVSFGDSDIKDFEYFSVSNYCGPPGTTKDTNINEVEQRVQAQRAHIPNNKKHG